MYIICFLNLLRFINYILYLFIFIFKLDFHVLLRGVELRRKVNLLLDVAVIC